MTRQRKQESPTDSSWSHNQDSMRISVSPAIDVDGAAFEFEAPGVISTPFETIHVRTIGCVFASSAASALSVGNAVLTPRSTSPLPAPSA